LAAGGGGENAGREGEAGGLGVEDVVALGFQTAEAALLPIGIDHGLNVVLLVGGLGCEALEVFVGELLVFGGIFAGDDGGRLRRRRVAGR